MEVETGHGAKKVWQSEQFPSFLISEKWAAESPKVTFEMSYLSIPRDRAGQTIGGSRDWRTGSKDNWETGGLCRGLGTKDVLLMFWSQVT